MIKKLNTAVKKASASAACASSRLRVRVTTFVFWRSIAVTVSALGCRELQREGVM